MMCFVAYNVTMTKPVSRPNATGRSTNRLRSRAAAQRSSLKKRIKTAMALLLLLIEASVALSLVVAVVYFWKFSNNLPTIEDLRQDVRPPVATTIWSQDGVLLGTLQVENRKPIKLEEMPKDFLHATVAIEDHRFYEHPGVDWQSIARAFVANVTGSNATRQGASTLTQQLVRNVGTFGLTKKKDYSRKIREALIAMRMEQLYSKDELLALYVNNIYYGNGAYGVQAASRAFFGKSAYKLSLSEAALLAGLPQRPSAFTPFEHRKASLKRRDEVLDNMFRYHYITQAQLEAAKLETPKLMPPQKHKDYNFKAPYFVWYVLSDLNRRFGADYVQNGLRIETTLNWKMQKWAEADLENGLRSHGSDGPNQGAMVSLDNNTGYIRALVGGRNFRLSQYNNVTMGKRQPGSTFKAFDYSAAFDEGACDLYDSFPDKPIPYPNDPKKIVHNFSGDGGYSYRDISCKTAIQFSKNTIAVQVAAKVGIDKVIEYAHRMGITTKLQPVLPTALGASEVHPLDLASAYTVFPLKGSRYQPLALVRVYDRDGNIVDEHIPELQTNIIKPHTAEQMDEAFEAVVKKGSGTKAYSDSEGNVVENAHGKTGTTSDSKDAWFAGYTPELTTVVWVAQVHHYNTKHPTWPTYMTMGGVTGGEVCAPIWHDFMMQAVPEQRKFQLPGVPIIASAPAPKTTAASEDETPVRHNRRHRDDGKTTEKGNTAAKPIAPNEKQNQDGQPANGTEPQDGTGEENTQPANNPDTAPVTAPPVAPPKTITPPPAIPRAATSPARRPSGEQAGIVAPPSARLLPSRPELPSHQETTRPEPSRFASATRLSGPPRSELPRVVVPEMVDVSVCADSHMRPNAGCTVLTTLHITRRQAARLGRCHIHKPPPGEE